LKTVGQWIAKINENTEIPNPTIMVLANKKDLQNKQMTPYHIEDFRREFTTLLFYEVSARSGH
jgi:hypothetical protein